MHVEILDDGKQKFILLTDTILGSNSAMQCFLRFLRQQMRGTKYENTS